MRTLVLLHDNRLMMASITATPIRARILEWPEDDAELFAVSEVPTDYSHLPPADITEQFAMTWALEFQFGEGIEPHDYLAPFPAFIRANCEERLTTIWQRRMAQRAQAASEGDFIPNPLREVA